MSKTIFSFLFINFKKKIEILKIPKKKKFEKYYLEKCNW